MAAILASAASALATARTQLPASFHFTQTPGPYAVGLEVVDQYDHSRAYALAVDELGRPYSGERARPMQTLVWYPARSGTGAPMTVASYGALWAHEIDFQGSRSRPPAAAMEWQSSMNSILSQKLWAIRDAPPADGRFPIVVYSPSFADVPTPWENADLCEYLASYGYVVVAAPNLGAKTPNMTHDVEGADTQARDISFLIGFASGLQNADGSHVAAIGFSWGGLAGLFAASRDNRIQALVSLDGSMRYVPGIVLDAGDIHPDRLTIPLLYFTQDDFSPEDAQYYVNESDRRGPSVLNAWTHGDLIVIRMLGFTHEEFGSMYQRSENTWRRFNDPDMPGHEKADYSREDGTLGYGWVARYTRAFLDAYIKDDQASRTFLRRSPGENGVPEHFMAVRYRPASGPAPVMETFRRELRGRGFERAAEVYGQMRRQTPDFKLEEGDLNSWAQSLLDDGHLKESIVLLRFTLQLYPDSSDAYCELGDAFREQGDRGLARENYQQCLNRDPVNREGAIKLFELH